MSKVAVVYWSGTGNTAAMATAVAEGAQEKGAEVSLIFCSEFDAGRMDEFDAVAFGCPSMGSEQLEEGDFEPMFTTCEGRLTGKKIALFGSYGWGDGECEAGRTCAGLTALYLPATASSAEKRRMGIPCLTARLWARRWRRDYGYIA